MLRIRCIAESKLMSVLSFQFLLLVLLDLLEQGWPACGTRTTNGTGSFTVCDTWQTREGTSSTVAGRVRSTGKEAK